MGQDGALHGLAVDHAHVLAGQEVQAVEVALQLLDEEVLGGVLDVDDGLEHIAGALLDELAHGVQVGGEDAACGEQALVVLALALAEQLLVPLVHQGEVGLVALEDLDLLALAAEDVAGGGVLVGVVVGAEHREPLHGVGRALHQLGDVDAGGGDGQQAHGRQHRVAAAHVVRHHEGGPALAVSQLLEGAAGAVGGGVDPLVGLLHADFLLQQLAQDAESQAGLGGGARFGDDVDREALALAQRDDVVQGGGADAVAAEVDLQALFQLVVVDALDGLHHGAGAQVAAADAGHHQHVGVAADLLGSGLDAGELFLIVIAGQIHPAQKVVAGAGLGFQLLVGRSHLRVNGGELVFFDKRSEVFGIKRNAHVLGLQTVPFPVWFHAAGRGRGPVFRRRRKSLSKCTVPPR